MKIANTLLPLMLLAGMTVAGCSFPGCADATCPNGYSKLTNIPVVYMNDLGRRDKKIQQSVQEYKLFLSYDKKSSNSPTTITVCTTCGFAYHREPKGYWEKDGRSFEEFRNPFPAVFQWVAKIRGKTHPELKQRVKRDHMIYEEMYFVDGLDVKEIRESILEVLKSADVQVH